MIKPVQNPQPELNDLDPASKIGSLETGPKTQFDLSRTLLDPTFPTKLLLFAAWLLDQISVDSKSTQSKIT